MFLAGLFLPGIVLPDPAQCSGSVSMDTKHRALPLTPAVPAGSCHDCPVWDPDLLPAGICTSLSLPSSLPAEQRQLLVPPRSPIPPPPRAPQQPHLAVEPGPVPFSVLKCSLVQSDPLGCRGAGSPGCCWCSRDLLRGGTAGSRSFPLAAALSRRCAGLAGTHSEVKRFRVPSAKFIK